MNAARSRRSLLLYCCCSQQYTAVSWALPLWRSSSPPPPSSSSSSATSASSQRHRSPNTTSSHSTQLTRTSVHEYCGGGSVGQQQPAASSQLRDKASIQQAAVFGWFACCAHPQHRVAPATIRVSAYARQTSVDSDTLYSHRCPRFVHLPPSMRTIASRVDSFIIACLVVCSWCVRVFLCAVEGA